MAYSAVWLMHPKMRIEVTQNRTGFFFIREEVLNKHLGYGTVWGKWKPVQEMEYNDIGELLIDGINFKHVSKDDLVTHDDITYRLPKEGGIVNSLPTFEPVIGDEKVIRLWGCYDDDAGAFEAMFVLLDDGRIIYTDNRYQQNISYRNMSDAERIATAMRDNEIAVPEQKEEKHMFTISPELMQQCIDMVAKEQDYIPFPDGLAADYSVYNISGEGVWIVEPWATESGDYTKIQEIVLPGRM